MKTSARFCRSRRPWSLPRWRRCAGRGGEQHSTLASGAAGNCAVEAEIDRIEAQAIERTGVPPDNQVQASRAAGKLMLYDKQLSVKRNEACVSATRPRRALRVPCRS